MTTQPALLACPNHNHLSRHILPLLDHQYSRNGPNNSIASPITIADIMENLSLTETPPPQQQLGGSMTLEGALKVLPPIAQQLPPQMFTTAAQLLDLTDSE